MSFCVVLNTRQGRIDVILHPDSVGQKAGLPPKQRENATLLIGAWLAVLGDSPLPLDQALKPKEVYFDFLKDIYASSLIEVIHRFSTLADRLSREAWRSENGTITGDLFSEFRETPVFKEYHEWKKGGDPLLFQYLLTFLRFAKKNEFDMDEFESKALRSWLEVEERLSELTFDGNEHIPYLRQIIRACTKQHFSAPTLMGKNGSGAVASSERGDKEKVSAFSMYPALERLFSEVLPQGRATEGVMLGYCSHFIRASTLNKGREGCSRLMFVPKNYKTARSICMEPIEFMFFQQHFRWEIENMIANGPLRSFITINDQTRNQAGAMYGSKTGLVDTIDLSAASDSVHVDLVKAIFDGPLLGSLLLTRTSLVEIPGGERVRVNKFAPMGSSLCFPVQSIVYAAVCIYAYILRIEGPVGVDHITSSTASIQSWIARNISPDFRTSATCESFAVYGDDIVCDSRMTTLIMSILEELGFVINEEKSFIGMRSFRESCGIFVLNGHDVTPFHYKGRAFVGGMGPDDFARYVSLANRAGDANLRRLQTYLINNLLRWRPPHGCEYNPIRFSSDRDSGFAFYSNAPRNTHIKSRWNEDLQRDEVRSWKIRPARAESPDSIWKESSHCGFHYDSYSLHMRYRASRSRGRNDEFVTPRGVLQGARISWGWTPT